jgi:hypothetical protein
VRTDGVHESNSLPAGAEPKPGIQRKGPDPKIVGRPHTGIPNVSGGLSFIYRGCRVWIQVFKPGIDLLYVGSVRIGKFSCGLGCWEIEAFDVNWGRLHASGKADTNFARPFHARLVSYAVSSVSS